MLPPHLVSECVDTATFDTFAVNVARGFLLCLVNAASLPDAMALVAGADFWATCTTFSTLAFEMVCLAEGGFRWGVSCNAIGSLVGALAAVAAGVATGGLL